MIFSQKVTFSAKLSKFVDILKIELEALCSHLQRVCRYMAFKKGCIDAMLCHGTVFTRESPIHQAKEGKNGNAAYYNEDNISPC